MDDFGSRLKKARIARAMLQGDLAERAGIDPAQLSGFESGVRKPSFDNLRKITEALDVSANFLLGLSDKLEGGSHSESLWRKIELLGDRDRTVVADVVAALHRRR